MFQLHAANERALAALRLGGGVPRGPVPAADLSEVADHAIASLRARRRTEGLRARLDARIRTDEPEHLDDPTLPTADRDRLDDALDGHNRLVLAYPRFVAALAPFVAEAAATRTPVRCLELASGSGRLALALAAHARRAGLPVEITGSDVNADAVASATRRAAGTPGLAFRTLDATTLDGVEPGQFDVVFLVQTAHHFTPGQLARITASGARAARVAFVGIDGYRAPWMPLVVAATAAVYPVLLHDGLISARKFYSEAELRLIGELAVGADHLEVGRRWPGWSTWVARGPVPGA